MILLLAAMAVASAHLSDTGVSRPGDDPHVTPAILVFSKTAGYRHDSIEDGVRLLRDIAGEKGWSMDHTEDAAAFMTENLARYAAVVWLNTSGNILDEAQKAAFQAYIEGGGGYVGIHAASDTEYEWPWYAEMIGAHFLGHPEIQPAAIDVERHNHPATEMLPPRWERTDEWYNFRRNPRQRDGIRVLMTLDESTYSPGEGAMGRDHPIAWYRKMGDGRVFYTALGHTRGTYVEPLFQAHIAGALAWATGVE
jgi:type 1 glutamine amidotransferase